MQHALRIDKSLRSRELLDGVDSLRDSIGMFLEQFASFFTNAVSSLETFVVFIVAIVTAVVLTKRKEAIGGSWLLAAACGGVWLTVLAFFVVDMVYELNHRIGIPWAILGFRLVSMFFYALMIVAIVKIKPASLAASQEETSE